MKNIVNMQTPFPTADNNLFLNSSNIYEGEKINDVSNLTYEERLEFIPKEVRKKVYSFKTYAEFCEAYDKCTNITHVSFPTDGYILTNNVKVNNLPSVYKSKAIPTVDLQYINGFLHLAGETHSSRVALNHNNYVFEEGKIYEFDLNLKLIKERKDKIENIILADELESISIFFVPWSNTFLDIMRRANK